jgi:hypothetical protein
MEISTLLADHSTLRTDSASVEIIISAPLDVPTPTPSLPPPGVQPQRSETTDSERKRRREFV